MTGGLKVKGTSNGSQTVHGDVVEGTLEDNGTLDSLDGVNVVNGFEVGVVSNNKTTTDGGDVREVNGSQVVVVLNGEVGTNGGDEWELKLLNGGLKETSRLVDTLKGGHGDGGDRVEGNVVSPSKVVELNNGVVTVEGNGQSVGNGLNVGGDGSHVEVVVDVENLNIEWVNTVQGVKLSVRNQDGVALSNLGKTSVDEVWKGDPVDGTNGLKVGKGKGRQNSQTLESELTSDGGQGVTGEGNKVSSVENVKVTVNHLHVGNGCGTKVALDKNVTLNSLAGSKLVKVSLRSSSVGGGERAPRNNLNGGGGRE